VGVPWTSGRLLRQRPRVPGACARVSILSAAVLALAGAAAQAVGPWSSPATIDRAGKWLVAVSCPSVTRCVAIESAGPSGGTREITFNASTLRASAPRTVFPRAHYARFSLACPAANRCVLVAEGGRGVTFDPGSGRVIAGGQITYPYPCDQPTCADAPVGDTLAALACPSVHRCTAVAGDGVVATFNPAAPGGAKRTTVDPNGAFIAVACPSPHQCTALEGAAALTFNPSSPSNMASTVLEPDRGDLFSIACPSLTQCTALTDSGDAITFNPAPTGSTQRVTIDASPPGIALLTGIACPSTQRCVAVDNQGRALVGDPQSTAPWTVQQVTHGQALTAVSCSPTARCIAVDNVGEAFRDHATKATRSGVRHTA